MAYIYDLSDQWAASGTTFTGIKLNVTDTASAAGSLLMDLQVGGVSKLAIDKTGRIVVPVGGQASPFLANSTDQSSRLFWESAYAFGLALGGAYSLSATLSGLKIPSNHSYGWSSATTPSAAADVILARDAANTLAQRNGVNAQAFNLYNTYTDASNYERGFMRFVSNVLEIGPEAAGTGTVRDFRLGNVNNRVTFNGAGNLVTFQVGAGSSTQLAIRNTNKVGLNQGGLLGWSNSASSADPNLMAALFNYVASGVIGVRGSSATDGGSLEFLEQTAPAAPAANGVRIYAEDDGAGKTRLMARFATGAAVQIAIEP